MTVSPDTHAAGVIDATPEALRYDAPLPVG